MQPFTAPALALLAMVVAAPPPSDPASPRPDRHGTVSATGAGPVLAGTGAAGGQPSRTGRPAGVTDNKSVVLAASPPLPSPELAPDARRASGPRPAEAKERGTVTLTGISSATQPAAGPATRPPHESRSKGEVGDHGGRPPNSR
jgi:hypothetical protein